MSKIPLTEEDWNFSEERVPDNELVPCLLWEYLRESQTARKYSQGWAKLRAEKKDVRAALGPRLQQIVNGITINHHLVLHDFVINILEDAWGRNPRTIIPWQKLLAQGKKRMAEPCNLVNPPVYISTGYFHLDQLKESVDAAVKSSEAKLPDGRRVGYPPARAMLKYLTRGPGCEAFCIVVDWGRYNKNAIKAAFKKLADDITKSPPQGITPQSKKGQGRNKPRDWRAKLQRLGLARIRSYSNAVGDLTEAQKELVRQRRRESPKTRNSQHTDSEIWQSLWDAKKDFTDTFKEIMTFEKQPPLGLWKKRS